MPILPTAKQQKDLLEYLMSGHSITGLEAINRLGIMALSQRIGNLKCLGWPIQSEIIHDERTGKHYSKYWLAYVPEPSGQYSFAGGMQ